VPQLALCPPPTRGRLVTLEDRLLRERGLHRNKVGALQMKIKVDEGNQRLLDNPEKIQSK
jgi:hypothetical protein